MTAPVTAIIAYDLKFYEKLTKLFPHNPGMRDAFAKNPQLIETTGNPEFRSAGPPAFRQAVMGQHVHRGVAEPTEPTSPSDSSRA